MTAFSVPSGPAGTRILGMGSYQPEAIVTNHDLAKTMDTSDEWIRDRVGIASRRFAGKDELLVDMAVDAGSKAIADSGLQPGDIGAVIVATCTMPSPIPNAAAQVAERIGVKGAPAFDVNAACAGFCYALATASDMVRSGSAGNVLVIGAEKLTDWVDPTDRSTAIIFADAAGAVVVGAGDEPAIGPVVWGSAGDMADTIAIADRNSSIHQEGQAVFRWATTAIAPHAQAALDRAGVQGKDIAAFVAHQANTRIIDGIVKRLDLPNAIIIKDLVESGNTSAASIPLALSKAIERREVPSGAPVLLFGFGGGLTYAGQVIRCP